MLANVVQRGIEHYEKKGQKEQRKALAKINQGDLKDAQKHQIKAQRAADKIQSLRPPTPPPVMAPTSPPMAAPPHPVAPQRPAPQNLKGYNFGGLGGGLGMGPVQTPSYTQPVKSHKMSPQPINQPQSQQVSPAHVMSPLSPAMIQPQPVHTHGHPGVHKFKAGGVSSGVASGGSGVSGMMSGGMGGAGGPILSSPQGQSMMSQPQMILSPQHANHVTSNIHTPQNRFSSQPFDNHVGVQPPSAAKVSQGMPMGVSMGASTPSAGVVGGLNVPQAAPHKVRPQKANNVASAKSHPPPPAPSTVSSERPNLTATELASMPPTLQFTEPARKGVVHTPASSDHVQLVKKW